MAFKAGLHWLAVIIRGICAIRVAGWLILLVTAGPNVVWDEWTLLANQGHWDALADMALTVAAALLVLLGVPPLFGLALASIIDRVKGNEDRRSPRKVQHLPP